MLQPKQVSETLDVPLSTLRRWAIEFEPFLAVRKGTKRSYTVGDLATFSRVKEGFGQGMNTEQVKQSLQVVERRPGPGPEDHALVTLSDFARALEHNQANTASLQLQLDTQAALIQDQQAKLDDLIARVNMPWYKRIGRK
jgi:DNA-binding transcriptional MerR regulator